MRARVVVTALPALLGLLGCGAAETTGESIGVVELFEVCADGPMLDGIDVSYYQGKPKWDAVADSGIKFAISRINHGGFMDPEFDTNWAAIKDVGLVRGSYQYFNPGGDPVEQANIVVKKLGKLQPGDLPPVIDVESTDMESAATIAANVGTWIDVVTEGTGRKPIIYTGRYFWNDNVASDAYQDHMLWIAHYTSAPCPNLPLAWADWGMWQFSSTGSIPGIAGNVDENRFNGDALALQDLAANGLRASIVSLEYPGEVEAGATATVTLVLKNEGARGWGEGTHLGTTEPRDRASVFASSGWVTDSRVVNMGDAVPSGETVTVVFDLRAPSQPGEYTEHFNLFEEGFAWFSDTPPGGGPTDDAIALSLRVVPASRDTTVGVGGGDAAGAGGASGIPNSNQYEASCALQASGAAQRPRAPGRAVYAIGVFALLMMGRRVRPARLATSRR
ncbi:MAG: hypothetical protein EXR75_06850 [Myxococcales bacterium]|nr:hypothetical protein [Myxococcales bacterium]